MDDKYFGFFKDLLMEFPTYIEEQDFYYGDTGELYDQICHGEDEFPLFAGAIALHGGPVLDLCCGSGRLTIPAAKTGVEVTGVDLSEDMLMKLERRLNHRYRRLKNKIRILNQDMTKLKLDRQYGMIMIGATSIRLLPGSFKVFFNDMYGHLKDGGALCFDIEDLPKKDISAMEIGTMNTVSLPDQDGNLAIILFQRAIDYAKERAIVNMAKIMPDREEKILLTSTSYRLFGLEEIRKAAKESLFGNIEIKAYNENEYFCRLIK